MRPPSPAARGQRFDRYRVGLHHLALRAASRDDVDAFHGWLQREGIEVLVDLDLSGRDPRYKSYRQVSLSSERFPARASFTFAEYEEA